MPRIIGKEGRNIAALRLVMKLYAKDGPNISLIVEDPKTIADFRKDNGIPIRSAS